MAARPPPSFNHSAVQAATPTMLQHHVQITCVLFHLDAVRMREAHQNGTACVCVCVLRFCFTSTPLRLSRWRFGGLNVGHIEWVNCNIRWHAARKALIIKSLPNIEYGFVSFHSPEEGGLPRRSLNTVHADCKLSIKRNECFVGVCW